MGVGERGAQPPVGEAEGIARRHFRIAHRADRPGDRLAPRGDPHQRRHLERQPEAPPEEQIEGNGGVDLDAIGLGGVGAEYLESGADGSFEAVLGLDPARWCAVVWAKAGAPIADRSATAAIAERTLLTIFFMAFTIP